MRPNQQDIKQLRELGLGGVLQSTSWWRCMLPKDRAKLIAGLANIDVGVCSREVVVTAAELVRDGESAEFVTSWVKSQL